MERLTLNDILENAADYGQYETRRSLWGSQIKSLAKNDITVVKIHPELEAGKYYCRIKWDTNVVWDTDTPLENKRLTQGERLWLITTKAVMKKNEKRS